MSGGMVPVGKPGSVFFFWGGLMLRGAGQRNVC